MKIVWGPVDASTPVAALLPDSVALAAPDSTTPTTMTLGHLATHHSGPPRLPANLNPAERPAGRTRRTRPSFAGASPGRWASPIRA